MIQKNWPYYLGALAILAGMILTVVSALKLCTSACTEAHNYRLFHMPFEIWGATYFVALALCHYFARTEALARKFSEILIAGGLGAELFFIAFQKYQIGTWCPTCLSIAASIGVLALSYLFWDKREGYMRGWLQVGLLIAVMTLGFTSSFFGVSKINILEAAETEMKEKIKFGNKSSPIEVYIFTDWACPACRAIESKIVAMAPQIMKEAQLTFVDTVVHPETLNYAPYNISFMLNDKDKYFVLRDGLSKLSTQNTKPTEHDIQKLAKSFGVKYQELPYEDVSVTMRYFDDLANRYKVTATPTVAVVNLSAKKGKKLSGAEEITEANVLNAIKALR